MKLVAIDRVAVPAAGQNLVLEVIEPGKPFEVDDDTAKSLIARGAAEKAGRKSSDD